MCWEELFFVAWAVNSCRPAQLSMAMIIELWTLITKYDLDWWTHMGAGVFHFFLVYFSQHFSPHRTAVYQCVSKIHQEIKPGDWHTIVQSLWSWGWDFPAKPETAISPKTTFFFPGKKYLFWQNECFLVVSWYVKYAIRSICKLIRAVA